MQTRVILLISLLWSSVGIANIRLVIDQPEKVKNHSELQKPNFQLNNGSGIDSTDILLFSLDRIEKEAGKDNVLLNSQSRLVVADRTEALMDFWEIFENRAVELKVKPTGGPIIKDSAFLYDRDGVKTQGLRESVSNPVQRYMIDYLGLEVNEAFELYRSLQFAFHAGGMELASKAYPKHFNQKLEARLLHMGQTLEGFKKFENPNERMQKAIAHEQATGRTHPFGPTSRVAQINEAYFDILKIQLLLGVELELAIDQLKTATQMDPSEFNARAAEQGRGLLKQLYLDFRSQFHVPKTCGQVFAG